MKTNAKPIRSKSPQFKGLPTSAMTTRYVISLMVLGLFFFAYFCTVLIQINDTHQLNRLNTFSAQQDKLIYQAGLTARRLITDSGSAPAERVETRNRLSKLIQQLQHNEHQLETDGNKTNNPYGLPPNLNRLLFNSPVHIQEHMNHYIQDLIILQKEPQENLIPANPYWHAVEKVLLTGTLSHALDEITDQYQRQTQYRIRLLLWINYISFFLTISVLFILGYSVFRPMVEQFRQTADRLMESNEKLRTELLERQRIQSELQESEALFRTMADSAPVLIWMADREGQFHYFNAAWLTFMGQKLEAQLNNGWHQQIHPSDRPEYLQKFTQAIDDRSYFKMEFRLKRADGLYRWLLCIGTPRFTSHGFFMGYIGSCIDITERREDEDNLKELTEKLSLSNQELKDFAVVASHDLQEPLRKVLAFSERLRATCEETIGPQGLEYLSRMDNATQRMQELINSLLSFSRVTTKAQPYELVNLMDVAREVINDLEIRIEQKQANVSYLNLPTIWADPFQMRQLFQNLISNSLKYSKVDIPPVITILSHALSGLDNDGGNGQRLFQRHPYVQLVFQDNGIGFEQKYEDRIFRAFQRLHGRTEYEGTGMGLTICRKIVERHGGTISVRSTPGEGSQFFINLPVEQPIGVQTVHESPI